MVRRLAIMLGDIITPECLQSIALEILKLDCVDWQYINALVVNGYSGIYRFYDYASDIYKASKSDIARTMQYFGQNMRNVIELD
ncbi:hypothetical protein GGI24_006722, partial [Coemansia furcata]